MERLKEIVWTEKTNFIDELLEQELTISSIPAGLEAEILHCSSKGHSAVLKIWNKASEPDVAYLYRLLAALQHSGISVSRPYGWGHTASNHQVLLTSYDGSRISEATSSSVQNVAHLLLKLHQLSLHDLDPALHKTYDFIDYFHPGLEEHPDIQTELIELASSSNMNQNMLIHGDFHLGNIVENEGRYTIIDWTNAQLGDIRYDFAWSSLLIHLYYGEELAAVFRDTYMANCEFDKEDILKFEAIACYRWLLLYRTADVPVSGKTIELIKAILTNNKYLNSELILI